MEQISFVSVPKNLLRDIVSISKQFEALLSLLPENVQSIFEQLQTKIKEIEVHAKNTSTATGNVPCCLSLFLPI